MLFGVDLRVEPGERVALLGPNGAGKTTLVLHLNGLLGDGTGGYGTGSVAVGGLPVGGRDLLEVRRAVGMVFQDPDDQLFMPTVARRRRLRTHEPRPARVTRSRPAWPRALEQVGLPDVADRPPHHLSFGQRRRVAVATVLAMEPSVLVLDEPTSNLDPASRRELLDVLTALTDRDGVR